MERTDNRVDPVVFGVSFGFITIFCIVGAVFHKRVGEIGSIALGWVIANLGWLFVLAATGFVIFALVVAFSRYGRIPLAREGEEPEFSTVSWVAMMFSAGMGIGLMFFGVFEPVSHLASPPPQEGGLPLPGQAPNDVVEQKTAPVAMAYTLFHWCLHPWAIYAVVGLALAYSTFRMGRGNLISSPFQALFGKKNIEDRGWGKPIDIFAVITTKFGSAVSLGLGALQIAAGLYLIAGIGSGFNGENRTIALLVIAVLTVGIVISAVSGVSRGIKWLSNTNMVLAALLLLFVFIVGPTLFILNLVPESIGTYLTKLIPMSFHSAVASTNEWLGNYTIFYWAWWISWTPFVGTFIARISRGRTIREFILGVLVVPTVVTILWFAVLGGAGMELTIEGTAQIVGNVSGEAEAFFKALAEFPFYTATGILVMFLTAIFFVSGADAGALVLSTLSSRGASEPKTWLVVLWAIMTGAVAAVLLWVGGLGALKTFTILASMPFVLIMIGLCWALYADLRRDPLRQRRPGPVRGHTPARPRTRRSRFPAGRPLPSTMAEKKLAHRATMRPSRRCPVTATSRRASAPAASARSHGDALARHGRRGRARVACPPTLVSVVPHLCIGPP